MRKLIILLGLLMFFSLSVEAAIKVSPGYVELDANKSNKDYITGSFSIAGGKDETVRFKIYPVFFEHDTKGRFVELEDKGQKNSLMGKIKFYPTEFTCQNGLDQKVRFTVTDLKSLPAGESRLVLFLEDVNTKEIAIKRANGTSGGRIIVKTRVGVPIYVDKGNYIKRGTLDAVAFKQVGDDLSCEYKVSSTGNSKIRYNGYGYLSKGDNLIKKFEINGSTVESGKFLERIQRLDIDKGLLKEGEEYSVKFVLTYKDENSKEKILKKEFTFIPNKEAKSTI